jgi:hypothetical protein
MKPVLEAVALLAGSMGVASAQGVDINIGRGGVHVGPGYDHGYYPGWRWRHGYRAYGRSDCRVIIRNHINRFGERVTERSRICD